MPGESSWILKLSKEKFLPAGICPQSTFVEDYLHVKPLEMVTDKYHARGELIPPEMNGANHVGQQANHQIGFDPSNAGERQFGYWPAEKHGPGPNDGVPRKLRQRHAHGHMYRSHLRRSGYR